MRPEKNNIGLRVMNVRIFIIFLIFSQVVGCAEKSYNRRYNRMKDTQAEPALKLKALADLFRDHPYYMTGSNKTRIFYVTSGYSKKRRCSFVFPLVFENEFKKLVTEIQPNDPASTVMYDDPFTGRVRAITAMLANGKVAKRSVYTYSDKLRVLNCKMVRYKIYIYGEDKNSFVDQAINPGKKKLSNDESKKKLLEKANLILPEPATKHEILEFEKGQPISLRLLTKIFPPWLILTITNISDKDVRLWEMWNSWGYYTIEFILKDMSNNKTYTIRRKERRWTVNLPSWYTLFPSTLHRKAFNLADGTWDVPEGFDFRRDWKIYARMTISKTKEAVKHSVCTGSFESKRYKMKKEDVLTQVSPFEENDEW